MSEAKKEESYTLADLADLKHSSISTVTGYIGMYVVNALADGMPCEELAAELQQFKVTLAGQEEIQRYKNQAADQLQASELSPVTQGADQ